jgi:hypothetical protein
MSNDWTYEIYTLQHHRALYFESNQGNCICEYILSGCFTSSAIHRRPINHLANGILIEQLIRMVNTAFPVYDQL